EVLRFLDFEDEVRQYPRDGRQPGIRSVVIARERIAFGGLHQSQLVDVARERGLSNFKSMPGQRLAQVILAGGWPILQNFDNEFLPCDLGCWGHEYLFNSMHKYSLSCQESGW